MGSHKAFQVPFHSSKWNVGLLLGCSSGQGPHLGMTGEPLGFSRVAVGYLSYHRNSCFLLCWPTKVLSSIRDSRKSWRCALVTEGKRGLCAGPNVHVKARQKSRGCIPDSPGSQACSRGETKDFSLFSSHDVYLLEATEWPKGSQASSGVWRVDSGWHSRTCRKRSPQLAMTWASPGFPRAAAPVGVFSRGTTRISGSLSCGAREVRSPCAWRGGARPGSRVTGGD